MEHDIIAYVYPHNDNTGDVSEAIESNPRYVPPRLLAQPSRTRYNRGERESTEPPENQGASALDYLPCLEFRFSDILPRTNRGLVFGYNPNCDIVLPTQGISNCHFSLTFDDHKRLIVKDMGSLVGTQVTYDTKGEGMRRDFQWIIGGHQILDEMKTIIITLQKGISFQIVVPHQNIMSPAYISSVDRLCQGTATAEGLLDDLGLSNPETRLATGAHTPGTGEIELSNKLGEGAFGVVTHLWNVSTGSERVVKAPTVKVIRKRQVNYDAWHREARIMGQISHPHIVKLIDSVFTPHPQLYLEYVPLGSLDDHEDISYGETLRIVQQCLSALICLHENSPPIAHRDIKPANILVQHRFEEDIYVKLGDFGLSRDRSELMTICGTRTYFAPEIFLELQRYSGDEERMGYTAAVDIWSLGVVACELTCSLPQYKDHYRDDGLAWCKEIIKGLRSYLQTCPSGLGQLLLDAMVILSPGSRRSARDCYDLAVDLHSTEDGGFHATLVLYPEEEEQTTLRYTAESYGPADPVTAICPPRSHTNGNATTSSYLTRSGAPPPESNSSSSAVRRCTNGQNGHELTHFLEDYAPDPFNPLLVGSSLASQFGEKDSWASQFSQVSVHQDQTKASIPRSENGGWQGSINEDKPISPEEYEEMEQAALLLQVIGRTN